MPYRVIYEGIPIECETADDAIAVARKLANSNGKSPSKLFVGSSVSVTDDEQLRLQVFIGDLPEHQKKLVLTIGEHATGISATALNAALGLSDNMRLGAHLSNVSKTAKGHGLDVNDLWTKRGAREELEFLPSVPLRIAVRNLHNPKALPAKQTT